MVSKLHQPPEWLEFRQLTHDLAEAIVSFLNAAGKASNIINSNCEFRQRLQKQQLAPLAENAVFDFFRIGELSERHSVLLIKYGHRLAQSSCELAKVNAFGVNGLQNQWQARTYTKWVGLFARSLIESVVSDCALIHREKALERCSEGLAMSLLDAGQNIGLVDLITLREVIDVEFDQADVRLPQTKNEALDQERCLAAAAWHNDNPNIAYNSSNVPENIFIPLTTLRRHQKKYGYQLNHRKPGRKTTG